MSTKLSRSVRRMWRDTKSAAEDYVCAECIKKCAPKKPKTHKEAFERLERAAYGADGERNPRRATRAEVAKYGKDGPTKIFASYKDGFGAAKSAWGEPQSKDHDWYFVVGDKVYALLNLWPWPRKRSVPGPRDTVEWVVSGPAGKLERMALLQYLETMAPGAKIRKERS